MFICGLTTPSPRPFGLKCRPLQHALVEARAYWKEGGHDKLLRRGYASEAVSRACAEASQTPNSPPGQNKPRLGRRASFDLRQSVLVRVDFKLQGENEHGKRLSERRALARRAGRKNCRRDEPAWERFTMHERAFPQPRAPRAALFSPAITYESPTVGRSRGRWTQALAGPGAYANCLHNLKRSKSQVCAVQNNSGAGAVRRWPAPPAERRVAAVRSPRLATVVHARRAEVLSPPATCARQTACSWRCPRCCPGTARTALRAGRLSMNIAGDARARREERCPRSAPCGERFVEPAARAGKTRSRPCRKKIKKQAVLSNTTRNKKYCGAVPEAILNAHEALHWREGVGHTVHAGAYTFGRLMLWSHQEAEGPHPRRAPRAQAAFDEVLSGPRPG